MSYNLRVLYNLLQLSFIPKYDCLYFHINIIQFCTMIIILYILFRPTPPSGGS